MSWFMFFLKYLVDNIILLKNIVRAHFYPFFSVRRVNSTSSLSLSRTMDRSSSRTALTKATTTSPKPPTQTIGVFTVSPSSETKLSDPVLKKFSRTRKLCLHNANISKNLGQTEKSDVWMMLAEMLANCELCCSDGFDGWGGIVGGSLGRDLVGNILKYYESLGDVQMLATIVCVLSGGNEKRKTKLDSDTPNDNVEDINRSRLTLNSLLPDNVQRYDSYMYQYASLLYQWGLLELRTELAKHMAHSFPGGGGELFIPIPSKTKESKIGFENVVPNDGVAPGISFATLCPRCSQPTPPETNVCMSCQDYSFRCSICSNAVRGLFTVCMTCSHGGHLNHIMAWFEKNTECPTGCGCKCVFNTFAPIETPQSDGLDFLGSTSTYSAPLGAYSTQKYGLGETQKGLGFGNRILNRPSGTRVSSRGYII